MRRKLLAASACAALLLSACSGGDSKYFEFHSATKLGQVYPVKDRKPPHDFSGDLLDGGTFQLASTKGKVAVVNFWATWCQPCQTETPQFALLYNKIHGTGVDFVGIDTADQAGQAKAFVKNNDVTYPIVFDQPGKTAARLGNVPTNLPFTVLVDQHGRVAAVYTERLSDQDLQTAIDKLQAER